MSDTPRTDAMIYPTTAPDPVTGEPVHVVHADDCRTLEQELNTWRELANNAEETLRRVRHHLQADGAVNRRSMCEMLMLETPTRD